MNNILVISCKDFANSSGQPIQTCEVKVFPNISYAREYANLLCRELEKDLPYIFAGEDYDSHIDIIGGQKIINLKHDVLYTAKNSPHAAAIFIRTEEDICNFIREKVDSTPDLALPIEDAIYTPMHEDDDESADQYLPINIVRRTYQHQDDYDSYTECIYDVEMKSKNSSGDIMSFVESLDCIGYRTLANIYVTLQNS